MEQHSALDDAHDIDDEDDASTIDAPSSSADVSEGGTEIMSATERSDSVRVRTDTMTIAGGKEAMMYV